MARGSFKGLYTFEEVARIYGMDSSNLRKMVQHNKFKDNEIKKFGKTWIITEQAIENHFGLTPLNNYNIEMRLKDIRDIKEAKTQAKLNKQKEKQSKIKKISKSKVDSLESIEIAEDIEELKEIKVDPNSVKASFNFSN